ncbi:hypothetical protein T4A_2564 [Trichinella pseudospiralis]|uniref:Uncharacterized protein n=2 Tax=Trichinella pseudospiralis TaxID=6337 RepID=A0A0V1EMB5_TRIPS|nr:hypothetical protein T4A_6691 [Trichinella pseudospiralis]KRY74941.1 hypothetical protein T4A_2564 [Trichinella pseudospiralis]
MRQTTSIGWKFLQLRPTSYVSTYTSATSASYHDASYQNAEMPLCIKSGKRASRGSTSYPPESTVNVISFFSRRWAFSEIIR